MKQHLVQIDGLRFFAVICVAFVHWVSYPQLEIFKDVFATIALNIFFVCSSFLITTILINSKNINEGKTSNFFTLVQFYIRRFLRIFPVYYVVIGITFFLNVPTARQNVFWYLSYTTNIARYFYGIDVGYFLHLWSLAVEEQFYLLFPFIVLFIPNKHLIKTFTIITILSILSKFIPYAITNDPMRIANMANNLVPGCFDCFGIGALLSYYFIYQKDKLDFILNKRLLFFLCFILFVILTVVGLHNPASLPVTLFWQFLSCICCFWIVGMTSLRKFKGISKMILENKIITYIGKISYGIYVYHLFIPLLLVSLGLKYYSFTGGVFVYAIIYYITTIVIAMVSWHLFENPINKLKKYFKYTK